MNAPTHRINVANLRILRDFLQDNFSMVDKHLNMESFCSISTNPQVLEDATVSDFISPESEHCGTSMCHAA